MSNIPSFCNIFSFIIIHAFNYWANFTNLANCDWRYLPRSSYLFRLENTFSCCKFDRIFNPEQIFIKVENISVYFFVSFYFYCYR